MEKSPSTGKNTYFFHKCTVCNKRFKVLRKDCLMISFLFKNKERYIRETYYHSDNFCPKCKAGFKAKGARQFLKEVLDRG